MTTKETKSAEGALAHIRHLFLTGLPEPARQWWSAAELDAIDKGQHALEVAFPALVRRCGATPLVPLDHEGRFVATDSYRLDLAAWRVADAAAALLVTSAIDAGHESDLLRTLFDQGDLDERVSVMRCMPFIAELNVVLDFMREAQRTNTSDLFEAAWFDHDLASTYLPQDDFNRMILKIAFCDLPLARVFGAVDRANGDLSRMLQDFATEREAAGRSVWLDTLHLIARAPVAGTTARVVGHLEHGDDAVRLAAVQAVAAMKNSELRDYLTQREGRERHPRVREALALALQELG